MSDRKEFDRKIKKNEEVETFVFSEFTRFGKNDEVGKNSICKPSRVSSFVDWVFFFFVMFEEVIASVLRNCKFV